MSAGNITSTHPLYPGPVDDFQIRQSGSGQNFAIAASSKSMTEFMSPDGRQDIKVSQPALLQMDARRAAAIGNGSDGLNSENPSNNGKGQTTQIHSSQQKPQAQHQNESNYSKSSMQSNASSTLLSHSPSKGNLSGQKRTAAGDVKPPAELVESQNSGVNDLERRRSKSIGSGLHGSKIAALSEQLRNRLSYAAAKFEKGWQPRDAENTLPLGLLQSPSPALDGSRQMSPSCIELSKGHSPLLDIGSPEGTTVSAPDASVNSHMFNSGDPARMSPLARSDIAPAYSNSQPVQRTSQNYPARLLPVPSLAPPADIISSAGSGRRRRPNPHEMSMYSPYNPATRHRRHHSQQELGAFKRKNSSNKLLVPGTPPPAYPMPTSHGEGYKQRTHSQNALMEQDAIETLLYLSSSPGASGHHPSSRYPSAIPNSIDGSIGARSNGVESQTHSSYERSISESERARCLEAQAGDDIDRMLDQMEDSDSEDGRQESSHRFHNFSAGR